MRKPTLAQTYAVTFVAFFCAVLVSPGLLMGRNDPWDSIKEGREPAEFPQLYGGDGALNPVSKEVFEEGFNDHLGLRDDYIRLRANVYVGLLRKSTSEAVYLGKGGWYFFAQENNIETATGEYPLGEAELEAIARNQQAIHDWYSSQGIDYVLVLTPSKATVYPEFLYGDYTVGQSPIDTVEQYLQEHTDVTVVNTKPAILAAKMAGQQVYWKGDTHWTSNGSYAAYEVLVKAMNEAGVLVDEPPSPAVPVFGEGAVEPGDLKRMLGDQYLFGSSAERIDGLSISQTSRRLPGDSPLVAESSEMVEGLLGSFVGLLAAYDNPAKAGTLLVYGDSFWRPERKLPVFLAEHYGRLVYAGKIPRIILELDELVAPDTVVLSSTERFLVPRLTEPQDIPLVVADPTFLDLPVRRTVSGEGPYAGGLVVDMLDGEESAGDTLRIDGEDVSYHTISGWAVDSGAGLPLERLYLKTGGVFIECKYGSSRPDVAEHFGNDAISNVGYSAIIPSELLDGVDSISFIAVGADGTYRLPERSFTTRQSAKAR
ncbi:MAG: hypothetical protein LBG11_01445 [Bifidobacteriaceae bacterium]|jgi:hypothetical protein|nr:hypothetical protein [Bifidobacteriaceae bacterium]